MLVKCKEKEVIQTILFCDSKEKLEMKSRSATEHAEHNWRAGRKQLISNWELLEIQKSLQHLT